MAKELTAKSVAENNRKVREQQEKRLRKAYMDMLEMGMDRDEIFEALEERFGWGYTTNFYLTQDLPSVKEFWGKKPTRMTAKTKQAMAEGRRKSKKGRTKAGAQRRR